MLGTPPIVIRIKKGADGRTSLSCTRADGTTTWQRQEGGQAVFFPRHDLTHHAVETVLGHRRGFYGLVAAGWDLSDFGTPWPRGKLPKDANLAEMIVGFFDRERASGQMATAEELNEHLATFCEENGLPAPEKFTEEDLSRVRRKRGELFAQWDAVQPGDVLELRFDPAAPAPSVAD
ncbi:MAG: hypothetical protein M3P26_16400 [Gemmatimonadota bacterium]|nr:hypothetical protein [Gemmatimonadota bacterium]